MFCETYQTTVNCRLRRRSRGDADLLSVSVINGRFTRGILSGSHLIPLPSRPVPFCVRADGQQSRRVGPSRQAVDD